MSSCSGISSCLAVKGFSISTAVQGCSGSPAVRVVTDDTQVFLRIRQEGQMHTKKDAAVLSLPEITIID